MTTREIDAPPDVAREASTKRSARRWYRSIPRACWACMGLAFVNALVWSVLTPVFQTPDEPVQVGYAQYIAETGHLPRPLSPWYVGSTEENMAMTSIPFTVEGKPSWSSMLSSEAAHQLDRSGISRVGERGAAYLASAPPLYFALEAIPYRLASSGNFFDRMFAMRAFSALLAALTVGFVYLFLRELLPGARYAWTIGALAVAFQPVFAFIGGGVSYDNLLWAASAALMWLVAHAFRHGLTWKVGAGIGAALVVGALTKGTMYGFIPGVLVALAVLVYRARDAARRRALAGAAVAIACFAVPFALWLGASRVLLNRSITTATSTALAHVHASVGGQIDWIWQFYLPRLPFMQHDWFTPASGVTYPLWQSYIQAFVGRFGWFQYGFPMFANWLGLAVYLVIGALAVAGLVRVRSLLLRRWPEVATFIVMAAGVMLLVNVAGYRYYIQNHQQFEQARYLFPLLPLYGAIVALAVRGAGRRWGPAVGAVLVVAALGQDVFAQFLTIGRYYT
jgi:4-amino-4-deoxy-L-arabinose transferase-like glycosyltransferase